ncbi:MAG TPA: hypothetical protein P5137_17145, partial [Candidatus Brocadiia bacterium]|nr:hypothetical protein [Candidatus Brocadiia bacterium]
RSRRWRQAAGPPPFREAARGSLDQDVAAVRFVVRDAKEEEGAGGPGRAAIDFEWTSHEPSSPIVETAWPCRLRAVWRRLGRDFDLPLIEETAEGPRFVDRGEAAPLRGQPSGVMAPPPALPARSRVRLCQRGEEWSARMPSPFALRPGLFALGAVWTGLMGGAFALSLRETPAASWPLLFQGGLVALAAAGLAVMAAAVLPWISRQRVEVTREGVRAGVSVLGLWRTEKALPLEEVTAVVLGQTPGGALTAVWVDTAEDSLQLGEGLRGEDKRWLAEALRRAVGGPAAESGKRPRG